MQGKSHADQARRRLAMQVRNSLRELNSQLSLLNRRFSGSAAMKEVDWDCLELIHRFGPLGPSALARHAGLHPATLTGVLDRLQRGGWIDRGRDPDSTDRRAVVVTARRDRYRDLYRLFSGMNSRIDEICADYSDKDLELIGDFLRRTTDAGRSAAEELADG